MGLLYRVGLEGGTGFAHLVEHLIVRVATTAHFRNLISPPQGPLNGFIGPA